MKDPYLLLWLEAPLQAWGHDSKFDRRDSLDFPTKSGVLGLICCARGAGGEQTEWLSQLNELDMQTISYARRDSRARGVIRQPMLRDFHMVGSGYDDQDPWQSLLSPKTNEGKKAVGGGTKMTYRYYLQDTAFAVALQVPVALVQEVCEALKAPTWDLYLGRKNCVPTDFIYQGVFDDCPGLFNAAAALAESKNLEAYARILQGEHDGEVLVLNDVPVQLGPRKTYRGRYVTVQKIISSS